MEQQTQQNPNQNVPQNNPPSAPQSNAATIAPSNSAKFAFFYMLSLVALISMALSTGMIIFQIINKKIVDIALTFPGGFDSGSLKFAIAAVIIATPIYYALMWQINKNLISGQLDKNSGIRKWLTYFILLITSVVMIGWLIATIFSFLDGELTTKFILKALTALAISGSIFAYYFYDIRRESVLGIKDKIVFYSFYISLGVVIVSLVASFFFVESPTATRARKQDNAILDKFSMIDSAISSYYYDNGKVPDKLSDLIGGSLNYLSTDNDIKNPVTKQEFAYNVKNKNTYELCDTFQASNKNVTDISIYDYNDRWAHDAGYQCLSQKVRTDVKGNIVPDVQTVKPAPVPVK